MKRLVSCKYLVIRVAVQDGCPIQTLSLIIFGANYPTAAALFSLTLLKCAGEITIMSTVLQCVRLCPGLALFLVPDAQNWAMYTVRQIVPRFSFIPDS